MFNQNFNMGMNLGNVNCNAMSQYAQMYNQQMSNSIRDSFFKAITNMSETQLNEIVSKAKSMGISDQHISQGMDFINQLKSSYNQ